MKKLTLMIASLGVAAATFPAMASAAAWQPINQRQANLDRRIDMGVRNRVLTRPEAGRLRAEFRQIAQLEYRYRANGLNVRERGDLDRRFNVLSAKVRWEKNDRGNRRY